MAKKKPPFNQEMAIRGANRRLFARSPFVVDKLNESRKEFPRYKQDGTLAKRPWVKRQCEVCNLWVGSTKIAIDHIDPVVPPNGFPANFDMWDRINMFLRRLWCDKSNLQRICDDCHDKKTNAERIERLKIKYTAELDSIAKTVRVAGGMRNLIGAGTNGFKTLLKDINKYVAKKKTPGLEDIVERALKLKQEILALKASWDKN